MVVVMGVWAIGVLWLAWLLFEVDGHEGEER